MILIILTAAVAAALIAAVLVGSRTQGGSAANRQIADLQERVDQLEQSAVAAANELRRLEDSQRFTERMLATRAIAAPPPSVDS